MKKNMILEYYEIGFDDLDDSEETMVQKKNSRNYSKLSKQALEDQLLVKAKALSDNRGIDMPIAIHKICEKYPELYGEYARKVKHCPVYDVE